MHLLAGHALLNLVRDVMPARSFALIPAAGVGARLGAALPKQYLSLAGKPVLQHVLETFAGAPCIAHVFVVVSVEDAYIEPLLQSASNLQARVTVLRCGGISRQASVLNGLQAMSQAKEQDWILVHDAARPGLDRAMVEQLVSTLAQDPVGGLLALPLADTLKRASAEGRVDATIAREHLWAAQTPQMFRYGLLCRALMQTRDVTDEASAVEGLGLQPRLVPGSPYNFKLTLPADLALAELYFKGK